MAKLTAKTTKQGQKCVLIKDSNLYYRYKSNYNKELRKSNLLIDTKATLRYMSDSEIKALTQWKEPIEIPIVKTLKKGTPIEIKTFPIEIAWKSQYEQDYMIDVLIQVIGGEEEGLEFLSSLKTIQGRLETGEFEDLSANLNEATKYKIYYKDKPLKTKIFSDLAKVKASIMDAIGYNNKVYNLNQHYQEFSPEVGQTCPEWFQGNEQLKRKDMKDVKVYEWANRKKGKDSGFDALAYYDSLMDFMKVTAQYGSAVRQLYKDNKDGDFTTIVCFRHEDYKNPKNYYYDGLKESDTIKNALKVSKVKGHKKCSKIGKTAIAFKNESDAMKVLRNLLPEDYIVLDMSGTELLVQSERFVKNVARMKKLERILIDEFNEDFELETTEI